MTLSAGDEVVRARPDTYAGMFGLAAADMRAMTDRVAYLSEGAVQQRDAAKAAVGVFADDVRRTVPEIARGVARREAENNAIPEFLRALEEQIGRWRGF